MGCLLEFLFEIIFEGVFEVIVYAYMKLMTLIVPEKKITDQTSTKIKNIVITVSVLLGIILVVGVILLLPPDPAINTIGKYMTFIPLTVIGIQVILGIVMKIIGRTK